MNLRQESISVTLEIIKRKLAKRLLKSDFISTDHLKKGHPQSGLITRIIFREATLASVQPDESTETPSEQTPKSRAICSNTYNSLPACTFVSNYFLTFHYECYLFTELIQI